MIDKLIDSIKKKANPTVVGLDPAIGMMPEELQRKYLTGSCDDPVRAVADMFREFNTAIIDAVADIVPAVKPQIAMYEKYGTEGIRAYDDTCRYAASRGLTVIGDIKRGDISSTAAAYAAHIGGAQINGNLYDTWCEDAVTVNPYMGSDGIKQFVEACSARGRGIFVLLKTSNPSSSELQDLVLADGRIVYEAVAGLIGSWGADVIGDSGYSEVGAVVGATHREQGTALRRLLPSTFFLVPGYGAQGAGADDVAGFFDSNGLGAIVNSSRGITSAWKKQTGGDGYAEAARDAAVRMRDELRRVLGW